MTEARKAPIRTRELLLDREGYEGWKFTIRTNPPWGVVEDLYGAEDIRVIRKALAAVVLEWDFVDEEGKPYPTPQEDPEVLRRLPSDLVDAVLDAFQKETAEVPNT